MKSLIENLASININ